MTLPLSVLAERAADLVERGWCQKAFALDADGESTHPDDLEAVRWCLMGALRCVEPDCRKRLPVRMALTELVGGNIVDWNDAPSRTSSEVVGVLRRVSANLRAKG